MTATIRFATDTDLDVIVRFNQALAAETEGRELDTARLRRGVAQLLDDPNKGRYYLCELDGQVVGQTMITYEWSDWRDGWFWWIQSVYVAPAARGRGIFAALYRHIHAAAREREDVCGIRLYVDHDNTQAAAIYRALGMIDAHYHMLEVDFRLAPHGE